MQQKRPDRAREDLEWLFRTCESEMGVKSNFNSLILASKIGSKRTRIDDGGALVNGVQEDLHNEDAMIDALDTRRARSRLAATSKNRRVLAAYQLVRLEHQRVLELAFEARQYPPGVREAFGELAGIAVLTTGARALGTFTIDWLDRGITRRDARVGSIKAQAQRLLNEAVAAYARAFTVTPEPAEEEPQPPAWAPATGGETTTPIKPPKARARKPKAGPGPGPEEPPEVSS